MSKDPNKRHYFDKVKPAEVNTVLQTLADENAEISLWQKNNEDKAEKFTITGYHSGLKKLSLEPVNSNLLKKFLKSNLVNSKVLFKITVGRMHYFSVTTLVKDAKSGGYFISVLEELYRGQQRTNYRLEASKHVRIQFKMDEEVFECTDISAGGTSLIIPLEHKDRFKKGNEFEQCTLRFARKNFMIPKVRVTGAWQQKDRDGDLMDEIRLGIQFVNLPKDVEEELFKDVNSEARGEEIRKKFNLG